MLPQQAETPTEHIANVADEHAEPAACTRIRTDGFIDVRLISSGEIVEANDVLSQSEQFFDQIRADESRGSGDQPGFRFGDQLLAKTAIAG